MMNWVRNHIHNEGYNYRNRAFGSVGRNKKFPLPKDLPDLFIEVISKCSNKDKDWLTEENFKKLKIIIVNQYCFNTIRRISKKDSSSNYEYIIFIPQEVMAEQNKSAIKEKIAHELAHFLFELQNKNYDNEEEICNEKVKEWGFLILVFNLLTRNSHNSLNLFYE